MVDDNDMKTTQASPRSRSNDPGLWAFCLLTSKLIHKLKSLLLARTFNAPGLYLGRGCVVRGANYITFGRDIHAHGSLWLEAVSRYNGQVFMPHITIEDGVSFSEGVHITCIDSIILRAGTLMGSHVYISDHNHGTYKGDVQSLPSEPPTKRTLGGGGPVIIGERVWIGDNAVLVGPLVIGEGAIIGANSVVTRDVPAETIVVGVPAKPIKRFNRDIAQWEPV